MSGRDIAVTGIGTVTPAGIGTAATWGHLLTGRPTAAPDPLLVGLAVDFSRQVPGFDAAAGLGLRTGCRLDRLPRWPWSPPGKPSPTPHWNRSGGTGSA
ncbi:hypothetical protein GCM10010446_44450 [Streptomyces enissocaesilis]|uniref:Beta-ketoacyl synthase N-terminal domain-containing protein n=1 Tax=Streptomyces enissocaesilis TaxID=332589 RepID=A0ABN3XFZ6_9ACTN